MPTFQGDNLNKFHAWVHERTIYPEKIKGKRVKGLVVVSFIVETDGSLSFVEILGSDNERLSQKALRIISQSPTWKPGRQRGEPVRVRMTLPVNFELPADEVDTFGEADFPLAGEPGAKVEPEAETEVEYFLTAEQMPSFQGGDLETFHKWVATQVHYPAELLAERVDGTVVVSFIVNKDGRVSHIKGLASPDERLTELVTLAIGQSPMWEPGRQDGNPVNILMNIPVKFDLSKLDGQANAVEHEQGENTGDESDDELYYPNSHPAANLQLPDFSKKGGLLEFRAWVMNHIKYPEEAHRKRIQGTVVISFIVDKEGRVKNVKTLHSLHPILEAEVLRVVAISPKWKSPGSVEGKPVNVQFTLPVGFFIPR